MRNTILKKLRERIIQLELKPGEPLNEKKIAEEFKVSRTPIREVLILLSNEGLVTITPNRGARVSDVNLSYYRELVEFRMLLERGAARLATRNVTGEQIDKLKQLDRRIKSTDPEDITKLMDCDIVFHRLVRESTNNNLLKNQMAIIQNQFTRVARLISYKHINSLSDVNKLIEALTNKNAKQMEKILTNHIEIFVKALGKETMAL